MNWNEMESSTISEEITTFLPKISCGKNNIFSIVSSNGMAMQVWKYNYSNTFQTMSGININLNPVIQFVYDSEKHYLLDCENRLWVIFYDNYFTWKSTEVTGLPHCKIKWICVNDEISGFLIGADYSLYSYQLNDNNMSLQSSKIRNIENVQQISCGNDFVIVICTDTSMWAKGKNDHGELGLGDTNRRDEFTQITKLDDQIFTNVSCGKDHCVFLTKTQNVYSCGDNTFGQLGTNSKISNFVSTLVLIESLMFIKSITCVDNNSFCIDLNGSVFTFGFDFTQLPLKHEYMDPVVSINVHLNRKEICNTDEIITTVQDTTGALWICDYSGKPNKFKKILTAEEISFSNNFDNLQSVKEEEEEEPKMEVKDEEQEQELFQKEESSEESLEDESTELQLNTEYQVKQIFFFM